MPGYGMKSTKPKKKPVMPKRNGRMMTNKKNKKKK
jgi:hypothetical protein